MTTDLKGGRLASWAVPTVLGLLIFVFRALSVSDLSNDHYMSLGWAQQVVFGEWPERDFVDPGMPLSYLASAAVQYVWPGPFSELLLTAGMLAVAAAVTTVVAAHLSGRWGIGLFAALVELAFNPRFYSFPKVLTPAVALLLIHSYASAPSRRRAMWLGVWAVTAALFRHDLGLYIGLTLVAGLMAAHGRDVRQGGRAFVQAVAGGALLFVPYAVYVQWAVGWPEHLRRGVEFFKADAHQVFAGLPELAQLAEWNRAGTVAFLFFANFVLLLAATATLATRWRELSRSNRSVATAALVALVTFLPVILRQPIDDRLPDLAAVTSLVMAWLMGQCVSALVLPAQAIRKRISPALPVLGLVLGLSVAANVFALGRVSEQIDNTGVYAGWRGIRETWGELRQRGSEWPWARMWPSRDLPEAIRYLNACTASTDALLLTWPAPEYNFFAQRRFAAGHVEFLPPSAYTTELDQQQMLDWLARQSVPVTLTNKDRYEEFVRAYPRVAAYLSENYEPFATFSIYDSATIVVSSRRGLTPTSTWGPEGWPCGFGGAGLSDPPGAP